MSRRLHKAGALAVALFLLGCTAIATTATIHKGGLRISVLSQIKPYKLPRKGGALIGSGRFWANIVLPDQGPTAPNRVVAQRQ